MVSGYTDTMNKRLRAGKAYCDEKNLNIGIELLRVDAFVFMPWQLVRNLLGANLLLSVI